MKTELVVTNFPHDECDILVKYRGKNVIEVTDCNGESLELNKEQAAFINKEIEAIHNKTATNAEAITA